MALAVLPELPCRLEVFVSQDRLCAGRLVAADDRGLIVSVAAGRVGMDERCLLVVMDDRRAGYEIAACVVEVTASDPGEETVRFLVDGLRRLKSRRSVHRALVRESALLQSHEAEFDVRVIDVGMDGFAFVSEQSFPSGDEVSVMLNVERSVVPVTAQVTNCEPLGFGRFRVGCRFLRIADGHRALLDRLAHTSPNPSDRRIAQHLSSAGRAYPSGSTAAEILPPTPAEDPMDAGGRGGAPTVESPTALYCRTCARITVHQPVPGAIPPFRCVTCQTTGIASHTDSYSQGADPRAA